MELERNSSVLKLDRRRNITKNPQIDNQIEPRQLHIQIHRQSKQTNKQKQNKQNFTYEKQHSSKKNT